MWDMAVPYIMLGYNSSVQASTGLSPYEFMYGVPPTVPPAIKERYGGAIELDDPAMAAAVVLRRAQALRECCIIAGDNILIAQHREPYDMPRCGVAVMPPASSTSSPRLLCLRREPSNTALMDARPQIFRIVEVRRNGVLLLEGRCSCRAYLHGSPHPRRTMPPA